MANKQLNLRGVLHIWILLLLTRKPMSGYELMKTINELTSQTWKPTTGSIYPALKKLEKESYIRCVKKGKREKKIYSITPEGRKKLRELRKRILTTVKSSKIRNVINCFLWPNEPEELRREFELLFVELIEFRETIKERYKSPAVKKLKERLRRFRESIKRLKNEV